MLESQCERQVDGRLTVIATPPKDTHREFADAVVEGLSKNPKTLPSRFFYDFEGSELFEKITELPEYYLTRTEAALFQTVADDIVSAVEKPLGIVEFGSGSSKKTRLLIDAALRQQKSLSYVAIDIAKQFLIDSSKALLAAYPQLRVTAISAEYFDGIRLLPQTEEPRLFLFLGSNIGNFEDEQASEFLRNVREQMKPSDALLVGIDLAKGPEVIFRAYNDSKNITQEFNKNLLRRINRELGGNFDLDRFAHQAPYDPETGRVEMRLVSLGNQTVSLAELGRQFEFKSGEYIHTEISRKYNESVFTGICEAAGFGVHECWFDPNRWFGLFLLQPSK